MAYETGRIRAVRGRVIEIDHLEFPQEVRSTLTAAMAAAGVTATVQSTTGFVAARYVLIGELGQETSEIVNESAVPTATTLTVAAVAYPHSIGTEVHQILFNQWRLYGNTTDTSVGAVLVDTFAMDVSAPFTSYVNTGVEYAFYFVRPFDSVRTIEGATFSDSVRLTTSYPSNSVGHLIRQAVVNAKRPLPLLGSNWAYAEINECLRVTRSLLKHWTNLQTYDSPIGQTARGGYAFTMPTDIYDVNSNRSLLGVRVGTGKNLTYKDKREWENLLVDVAQTTVRTAAAVNDRTFAITNSFDFKDDGSVSTGLVGLWNFNENTGTTAFDYTTNANNGTITGAAYVAAGASSNALDFDGIDDVVVVTDATAIQNVFDTGGAVSFWINPDTDGEGDLGIIATKGWIIQVYGQVGAAMGIQFTQLFSGTNGIWTTAVTTIPTGVMTHVLISYDNDAVGNNPIIYIGGTSVTVTRTSTPVGVRTTDVGTALRFGNNAATTNTFDGRIDEMRMYSRLLSAGEATTLQSNPGGASGSVNVYINGVQYAITYTDLLYSATVGALLGVPFTGTGSITVAIPAATNVWQNETEGTPTWYTVYDGSLYIWYLPDAANDNRNVVIDYFTEVVDVNSDGDLISFTEFDQVLHWLVWKLRALDRPGGEAVLEDPDYRMYQTIVNQMMYQELGKTGKYKMRPFLPNVTTGDEGGMRPKWTVGTSG